MEKIEFHPDFRDFLRLLNSHWVEYLLVGGYTVGLHGYPRATGDMDVWIAVNPSNAKKTAMVLRDFGIPEELITNDLFLDRDTGMGSDQAKCMIEQEKSEKLHSFWALECRFCG